MAYEYSNPNEDDVDFRPIFAQKLTCPASSPIPKIAHFVHTEVKELTWLDWATVRGAIVNLGVEKVHIWLPKDVELKGWIWNRVLEMQEVKLRRIAMPKSIYKVAIDNPERQADVVRLKLLYEEGGIFLDNDLISLKSSDDVIYDNSTRATVMARQYQGNGLPNGMIMSKPRSPFLKRWIEQYKDIAKNNNWEQLAAGRPFMMWREKDPDLTVLGKHAWFYPLSTEKDGDATLKQLWLGKSWHDIGLSYGTHFWHPADELAKLITPKVIRTIDTPLFCAVRKLFDNLDDDGYYAVDPATNANCSVTWVNELKKEDKRMFSDYQMSTDSVNMKWVDSSNHNNHGWAPRGMALISNETSQMSFRNVTAGSYAVLPVPADWDSRVWSARISFTIDTHQIEEDDGVGLFKIRMETGGEILARIRNDNPYPGTTFKLEWKDNTLAGKAYQKLDELTWMSQVGLPGISTGTHEMIVTLNRKDVGAINLFFDGKLLANKTVPTVVSPKIAQDIWFNAREWNNLDTGFRGTVNRFTMYADTLSPEDAASPIGIISGPSRVSKLTSSIHLPESSSSPWAVLFPCFIVLILILYMYRRKKSALIAIPEYANKLQERARSLPLFGSKSFIAIPEYANKLQERARSLPLFGSKSPEYPPVDLSAFRRTFWERTMDIIDRILLVSKSEPVYKVAATEDSDATKEHDSEDDFQDTELGIATTSEPTETLLQDPEHFDDKD